MNKVLQGSKLSKILIQQINLKIQKDLQLFKTSNLPQLDIINIAHHVPSLSYIMKKIKIAKSIGIRCKIHQFSLLGYYHPQPNYPGATLQKYHKLCDHHYTLDAQLKSLYQLINQLNQSKHTSAILIQLPIPLPLINSTNKIINMISAEKDVDCLTFQNRINSIENSNFLPCTPGAVLSILNHHQIPIQGQHICVIGRSALVGQPLSQLLLARNATVTVCQKQTIDLHKHVMAADIVIAATGVANLVKQIKPGSIVIDIGINRSEQGKLCGDVTVSAKQLAKFSTPVPGGVGPVTVAMLMNNIHYLWKQQHLKQKLNQFQQLEIKYHK